MNTIWNELYNLYSRLVGVNINLLPSLNNPDYQNFFTDISLSIPTILTWATIILFFFLVILLIYKLCTIFKK